MTSTWHRYDAGFFNLEVPSGWIVQHPNAGTLLLQDPDSQINMTLLAVTRTANRPPRTATPLDARVDLRKWIESQRHVQVGQLPRMIAGAPYPTATTEGLQPIRASGGPWYRRLLRRLKGSRHRLMLWRFWGIANAHLLILANCNGSPASLERHRGTLDRLIGSIRLPQHELLLGREFAETVAAMARSAYPRETVAVIDDSHLQFGALSVGLGPLHRKYLARPADLATHVAAYLSQVQESVPASQTASWMRARERVMPLFLTERTLAETRDRVVHEEWINGLAIGYVLEDDAKSAEEGPAQRMIMQADLARWDIDAEELHGQAVQNLVAHSREHVMEGRRSEGLLMLRLAYADRHNAARILLPELHRKLREHLGATFYAAMPGRDILVAFNSTHDDILSQLRRDLEHDFHHAREPLSPKFFQVTPDGIAGDPIDAEDIAI
jgi:hypothetical protein